MKTSITKKISIALGVVAIISCFSIATSYLLADQSDATTYTLDPVTVEPITFTVVATPATGATINLDAQRRQVLLINPATAIAILTVNFPPTPLDKDQVVIGTSKAITLFTIGGNGGSVIGTLSTLLSGGYGRWIYNASSTTWFRIG